MTPLDPVDPRTLGYDQRQKHAAHICWLCCRRESVRHASGARLPLLPEGDRVSLQPYYEDAR